MRIAELVRGELKSPTRPQTSDDPVTRLRSSEELSRARDFIYDAKAKIEKALATLEPRYMPHQPLPRAAQERALRVAEAAVEQSPRLRSSPSISRLTTMSRDRLRPDALILWRRRMAIDPRHPVNRKR
jgi:hypothetical protein